MRIDSHQHFWAVDRGDYGWLTPELTPLYRDYGPEDLAPSLAAAGIDGTVLVQAADTVAETEWMLRTAQAAGFVLGVVGWVDFDAPTQAVADLDRLASHGLFKGVRPMIQDLDDDAWMLRDGHGAVLDELVRRGLTFDALVKPRHLPHLIEFVARHSSLRVVIDHGAKPEIGTADAARPTRGWAAWAAAMSELARASSTVVKLSGLVTEANGPWTVEMLRPYADHLLEAFGPERILWGSDWPVLRCAGEYETWVAATDELLAPLSATERARILGGNAAEVYGLAPPQP